MAKVKVCPDCGELNKIVRRKCVNCGEKLTDVVVQDEDSINKVNDCIDILSVRVAPNKQGVDSKSQGSNVQYVCPFCSYKLKSNKETRCSNCEKVVLNKIHTVQVDDLRVTSIIKRPVGIVANNNGILYDIRIDEVLGRDYFNKSPLNKTVSRRHVMFTKIGNINYVTDLNSTNGTFVNGKRITMNIPEVIRNNDIILLGNLSLTIEIYEN